VGGGNSRGNRDKQKGGIFQENYAAQRLVYGASSGMGRGR